MPGFAEVGLGGTQGAATWVRCSSLPRWANPLRSCRTGTWLQGALPLADSGCDVLMLWTWRQGHAPACVASPCALAARPVRMLLFLPHGFLRLLLPWHLLGSTESDAMTASAP